MAQTVNLKMYKDSNYKFVDASKADQGATGDDVTVYDYMASVGTTKKATLVFSHSSTGNTTTYTFSTSEEITSNFDVIVENGAILSIDSGMTLTVSGTFYAAAQECITGSGTVVFAKDSCELLPEWWGSTNPVSKAATGLSDGGVIRLGQDVYSQSAVVTRNDMSFSILGGGPEVSEIRCTGVNGIVADTNDSDKHVTLKDFTLSTTTSGGGHIAILLTGDDVASNTEKQFLVDNVNITPHILNDDYWAIGIKLIEGWGTVINNCFIRGYTNNITSKMDYGIQLGQQSLDVVISNTKIYFCDIGIYSIPSDDDVQLLHVTDCTIVYVTQGIAYLPTATTPASMNIRGNHISAVESCVNTDGVHQMQIVGNLLYRLTSSSGIFLGINAVDSNNSVIVGNTFMDIPGTGTSSGITLDNCYQCSVVGNTFDNFATVDINIVDTSTKCTVVGNTGDGTLHISDGGIGTLRESNYDHDTVTVTTSGAISSGVKKVLLNNASAKIELTIAVPEAGRELTIMQIDSASQAHTVTLTAGTWDGTNNTATFEAQYDTLTVLGLSATLFRVIYNNGSVVLSSV